MDADAGTPGRRERHKLETRAALRETAMLLFAERGYANTTVADIADGADVSERTFFRYFSSKEDVLLADVSDLIPRLVAAIGVRPPEEAPLVALAAALASLVEASGRPPAVFLGGRFFRDDKGPSKRLMSALIAWETEIADALVRRFGGDPGAATDDLRFHASVVACAATSALRSATQHYRRLAALDTVDPAVLIELVQRALHLLSHGCPDP